MKKKLLFLSLICCSIIATGCTKQEPEATTKTNLPTNPASIYCEDNGGSIEIIKNKEGEFGMCKFDDGSECEERDFYNGECLPGYSTK